MIEENGRVVAVEVNAVWVETVRQTACESCAARKGCGQSALAKIGNGKKNHVKALNLSSLNLDVGDGVVIGIPEDVVMKGTLVAYMMPLVFMLVSAVAADSFSLGDLAVTCSALLGLLMGFACVRLHFFKIAKDQRYQPKVLRKWGDGKSIAVCLSV